jgi:hypothetical protein
MTRKYTAFTNKLHDDYYIRVLMAACAWNLRKWMVAVAIFLFWKKVGLFFVKYPRFFVVR